MIAAHATDLSVPDFEWWHSPYAESEDFVGIGTTRIRKLVAALRKDGESSYIINRLLKDNGMPHGPTNRREGRAR